MPFTEAEKRKWHADRRADRTDDNRSEIMPNVCGHCGNPFPANAGVVTDDFALCDVCNGD
jgi:formylmethanofuran dehydrogenase subunit E